MDISRIVAVAEALELTRPRNFAMHAYLCTDRPGNEQSNLQRINALIRPGSERTPAVLMRAAQRCGTHACIAGYTVILFGTPEGLAESDGEVEEYAQLLLGIGDEQAADLFAPATVFNWQNLTPADAARTLRHLADTGTVDWTRP